ncbi:MAG: hypothetical protein ABEI77_06360 [Halorientalis sp.]
MSRLRFQESLSVWQSYIVALSTSLIALFLLGLAATARVTGARETLTIFGTWFIRGLAYTSPVMFGLSWGSLPGNLPRLVRRIDPAQVNDEPISVSMVTIVELFAILLTALGIVGFWFFVLIPEIDCPPGTVGPFNRSCTIAQSLGMTKLFGIGLYGYVTMYLLAHPLWLLVWIFE